MATEKVYIDKFASVVIIDTDHPLAVAQRAKDAASKKGSGAKPGAAPVVTLSNASTGTVPPAVTTGTVKPPATPPVTPPVTPVSASKLAAMRADALKELCAERKIEVPEGATRKDMIALLTPGE